MKTLSFLQTVTKQQRRGSTLVIVIALLGLLAFTGMVFFTFASQEQQSAANFAAASSDGEAQLDDVFDWGLRHVIVGASDNEQNSITYSATRRHSLVQNLFGSDISPGNGSGVTVDYNLAGIPVVTPSIRLLPGEAASGPDELIDLIDSPAAWGLQADVDLANNELSNLFQRRGPKFGGLPAPDVGYTYPDINNMFLAYRGFAIRDNAEVGLRDGDNGTLDADSDGDGFLDVSGIGRYELIPITIPSFFRPALLKTAGSTRNGNYVPTNPDWAEGNINTETFGRRSFRPNPTHVVRNFQDNTVALRYFSSIAQASAAGLASGPFPFLPPNQGGANDDSSVRGELGFWTGSYPTVVELDVDNDQFVEADGSTTNEGIWLDLHFPLQEHVDSGGTTRTYVVMHSFSIYDLDSLINVNVHGNLANLTRNGTLPAAVTANDFSTQMISASDLGLGPHEINPTYALRRDTRDFFNGLAVPSYESTIPTDEAQIFTDHFGRVPTSAIEQANMELFLLLVGRAEFSGGVIDDIHPGRWGDIQSLYFALNNGGSLSDYPRPGRSDGQDDTVGGSGVRFGGAFNSGGTAGYDDNQDRFEGEALKLAGQRRAFGQPMDFAGTGRRTTHVTNGFDARGRSLAPVGNPLSPIMRSGATPESWPAYDGYTITRDMPTSATATGPYYASERYLFGVNRVYDDASGDDLIRNPFFDALFEDPLETIFDPDIANRPVDSVFGPQDLFELHMTSLAISNSNESPSDRMSTLAKLSFDAANANPNRDMITTYSNSYRYIPFRHPFGSDGRPGRRGYDDDQDGVVDEADEILVIGDSDNNTADYRDSDSQWRWQEWTADTDGADTDDDGFPNGDGNLEFPPRFWTDTNNDNIADANEVIQPYSLLDPFRPAARRVISVEAGDSTSLLAQLPLSINHIIDVHRQWDETNSESTAPPEGTSEFLYYLQRAGLQFRKLTDHPHIDDTGVVSTTRSITLDINAPSAENTDGDDVYKDASFVQFPPETVEQQEFWAKRDRQQMARDIYVLLYTLGGGRLDGNGFPMDYTRRNDPSLAKQATDPADSALPHPNALYTNEELRRMAQFAVNVVDALDTDNVNTKFEYDKNFGNGWNLDDDPTTADFPPAVWRGHRNNTTPSPTDLMTTVYNEVTGGGSSPEDSGVVDTADADNDGSTTDVIDFDRGVVYGVEGQQFAFSEVFATRTPQLPDDHYATAHDDRDFDHDFLHVEIQNVSPIPVDFGSATSKDDAVWRLARFDRITSGEPSAGPNDFHKAMILLRDAAGGTVAGGERLTIGTGSPNLNGPGGVALSASDLYIDIDSLSGYSSPETWERISPDIDGTTTDPGSLVKGCDIDLLDDDDLINNIVVRVLDDDSGITSDGSLVSTKGAFLDTLVAYPGNHLRNGHGNSGPFGPGSGQGFELVLQRRANPNMPNLSQTDNPWVNVDTVRVDFRDLTLTDTSTVADITGELASNLRSRQRAEPIVAADQRFPAAAKGNFRHNSIGTQNSNSPAQWAAWQNHMDRDFASIGELFGVPVFGPNDLTQKLAWTTRNPYRQGDEAVGDVSAIATASGMILQPDFIDLASAVPTQDEIAIDQANDNRWYRLLQFIEVPSRVHRMLGNYLTQTRLPGKINLNMLRHREVFAGLIDDPFLVDLASTQDTKPFYSGGGGPSPKNQFPNSPFTHPATLPGSTDRWLDFIRARDAGVPTHDPGDSDSPAGVCSVIAPGVPGSRPFRPIGDENLSGLQDTILRTQINDLDAGLPNQNRMWAEVGSLDDHEGTAGAGRNATSSERYQLLSKLMNNTTTMSNSFIVFGTVGFFEAKESPTTGLVRVGGAYDLDGSGDATDDYKRAIFVIDRTEAINAFDPGSGEFDWQRLVKARLDVK